MAKFGPDNSDTEDPFRDFSAKYMEELRKAQAEEEADSATSSHNY